MFTLGKKLSALIALMCLVSLSGCPPLEDGTIPIGDPAGSEAESAREALELKTGASRMYVRRVAPKAPEEKMECRLWSA